MSSLANIGTCSAAGTGSGPSPTPTPIWRSMLFVPAHIGKFVEGAHLRGADAYILDLEDSVPVSMKQVARDSVQAAAIKVSRSGAAALVRINEAGQGQALDLAAAVCPAVAAIVLPKVGDASAIVEAARIVDSIEARLGMAPGFTRLIALIEDVRALPNLDAIAGASSRLIGMILGTEDFSASAGMQPTREALIGPSQQVQFACRRAGLLPFGYPASIAEFADADALRGHIALARQLGFVGAFCIHPSQVEILNEGFSPAAGEVAQARLLIEAFDRASAAGQGAIELNGKMIDLPVVLRARELLSRASHAR